MAAGKNIHLFLMDGNPRGRIKCSLANWTGVAYKIPRTMLEEAKTIKYLDQTGVYFLFGNEEESNDPVVYVGQAGVRKNGHGIIYRLEEHKRNTQMDYWTEAVAFTSFNNFLGPTEISYLENQFCNMAIKANRYHVKNNIDPNPGNITEEKQSELDEFISYSKLVMGALGYKVFEPLIAGKDDDEEDKLDDEPLLYFQSARAEAKGRRTAEGFVVLAGSFISSKCTNSCPKHVLKLRESHKDKINSDYILTEDLLFTSPSTAAGFVGGASLSGMVNWKDENGKTLKEIDEE